MQALNKNKVSKMMIYYPRFTEVDFISTSHVWLVVFEKEQNNNGRERNKKKGLRRKSDPHGEEEKRNRKNVGERVEVMWVRKGYVDKSVRSEGCCVRMC